MDQHIGSTPHTCTSRHRLYPRRVLLVRDPQPHPTPPDQSTWVCTDLKVCVVGVVWVVAVWRVPEPLQHRGGGHVKERQPDRLPSGRRAGAPHLLGGDFPVRRAVQHPPHGTVLPHAPPTARRGTVPLDGRHVRCGRRKHRCHATQRSLAANGGLRGAAGSHLQTRQGARASRAVPRGEARPQQQGCVRHGGGRAAEGASAPRGPSGAVAPRGGMGGAHAAIVGGGVAPPPAACPPTLIPRLEVVAPSPRRYDAPHRLGANTRLHTHSFTY